MDSPSERRRRPRMRRRSKSRWPEGCRWGSHWRSGTAEAFPVISHGPTCTNESSCLVSGQSGNVGIVVGTGNGGCSWREYLPSAADDIQSVSCTSGGTCAATGVGKNLDGFGAKRSDGGRTWQQLTLPFQTDSYGATCAPGGSCWATWGGLSGGGGTGPVCHGRHTEDSVT